MEWFEPTRQIIVLIIGLFGLISAGVGAFFAIRSFVKSLKGKSANEVFNLLLSMTDEAMKAAEASGKSGADKKKMVIDAITAAAISAEIDIAPFMAQLSDYIDQTIKFVNDMTKK